MNEKISEELIRIIKSHFNCSSLVSNLMHLLNSGILNSEENSLCSEILDQIELFNTFDLDKIIKEKYPDINVDDIGDKYESDEIMNGINNFITDRKKIIAKSMKEIAYKNVADNIFDKETIDVLYNRYPEIINITEDSTLDDLEENIESIHNCLTGCYTIDAYLKGLDEGTITTIVGSNSQQKNILCLNIAYNLINDDKNVLYLSIGSNKRDVYKKLLIRHSCSKSHFELLEQDTSYNVLNHEYAKVYHDFKDNISQNIVVVDESDYYMSTQYSLLKTICAYDNKFKISTNHGIDVIIVDELSKMKLFNGKKYISNRNIIASEILSFLKNQANSLLSSSRKVPILVTYEACINSLYNEQNNVPETVNNLSDNVILMEDKPSNNSSSMRYLVFKNVKGSVMNAFVDINYDSRHWYVYDGIPEYAHNPKKELEEANKENETLKLEQQANIANNNIMLATMNKINTKIDSINKKLDSNESEIVIPDFNEKLSSNFDDILAELDLDKTDL